jgi:hypothetical protein
MMLQWNRSAAFDALTSSYLVVVSFETALIEILDKPGDSGGKDNILARGIPKGLGVGTAGLQHLVLGGDNIVHCKKESPYEHVSNYEWLPGQSSLNVRIYITALLMVVNNLILILII